MRVLFNQYHIHTRYGMSREYYEGYIEDFDRPTATPLLESGIVSLAPKNLQTTCVIKHNSQLNKKNIINNISNH